MQWNAPGMGECRMEEVTSSRRESCTVINHYFWATARRVGLCYWNAERGDSLIGSVAYDVATRVEQSTAQIGSRLLWENVK
jgi:hypothetical protein